MHFPYKCIPIQPLPLSCLYLQAATDKIVRQTRSEITGACKIIGQACSTPGVEVKCGSLLVYARFQESKVELQKYFAQQPLQLDWGSGPVQMQLQDQQRVIVSDHDDDPGANFGFPTVFLLFMVRSGARKKKEESIESILEIFPCLCILH